MALAIVTVLSAALVALVTTKNVSESYIYIEFVYRSFIFGVYKMFIASMFEFSE